MAVKESLRVEAGHDEMEMNSKKDIERSVFFWAFSPNARVAHCCASFFIV
jgi:hypothetical protein